MIYQGQKGWVHSSGDCIYDPDQPGFSQSLTHYLKNKNVKAKKKRGKATPPLKIGTKIHVFRRGEEPSHLGLGTICGESDYCYKVKTELGFMINTGEGKFLFTTNYETAKKIAKTLNINLYKHGKKERRNHKAGRVKTT